MQTFTAREYIKIDAASAFGLDKDTWDDRIKWFDTNRPNFIALLNQAENPALFYAAVKAYEDAEAGLPTGHLISLDATASGMQLLAALTGDRRTALLCNVVDTGDREDAYTILYDLMLELIGETAQIDRESFKQAIMTAFYGSKAVPKSVFGEGHLLQVFYHVMREAAPGAWELNEAFLAMWDPEAYSNDWVMPDNFHVHVPVINTIKEVVHFLNAPYDTFHKVNEPTASGRSLGANCTHSVDGLVVREMARRCDYDPEQVRKVRRALFSPMDPGSFDMDANTLAPMARLIWGHYQDTGYLSARILSYLDEQTINIVGTNEITELLASLPTKPFKVISIHDCFRCHPNYGNDLRRQYNLQLSLIARSNLLENLVSQIIKRDVKIGELDNSLHKDVVQANYALS